MSDDVTHADTGDTDEPEEPSTPFDEWAITDYRAVIADAGKDGTKRHEALEKVHQHASEAIAEGRLALPVDNLWRLLTKATKSDDDRTSKKVPEYIALARDIIGGDTLFDDDPILDVQIPLGDGRRKALRYLSIPDFQHEIAERQAQQAALATATARMSKDVATITPHLLSRFGASAVYGQLATKRRPPRNKRTP